MSDQKSILGLLDYQYYALTFKHHFKDYLSYLNLLHVSQEGLRKFKKILAS
jgi:hypothetical protein